MSWKEILKLDLSEAKKLTQELFPEEMSIFDSKGRKKMREKNKEVVLGRIASSIRLLESFGEFPQSKQFMEKYKKLETEVRLSKPWKYGSEKPKHESKYPHKDPYISYLMKIMDDVSLLYARIEAAYASHMA